MGLKCYLILASSVSKLTMFCFWNPVIHFPVEEALKTLCICLGVSDVVLCSNFDLSMKSHRLIRNRIEASVPVSEDGNG